MPYRTRAVKRQPEPHERPFIFAGALSLAGGAGFINAVVLGFFQVPVSHMSGAVSRLGADLAAANLVDLKVVLSIVGGFLCGAILSGLLIGGRKLMPGRRYGVTLLIEGGVLGLSTLLLYQHQNIGVTLAAMACGIQNAMASSYYGLVIRTTHVTGIVTDIGVMLGHWIRHRRIQLWKLMLLVSLLAGFFGGGLFGALAFNRSGVLALAIPSVGCLFAGTIYYGWRHYQAKHEPAG